jgi:hypothetical protein
MHLTTMHLIFGPEWIFNILMPSYNNWPPHIHMLLCNWSFGPKWIFNILMCPLANNWPPLLCTHYYANFSGPRVDIQHFNVPCQQLASSLCTSTMQLIFWSKEWIFNILMCPLANNWPLIMHLTTINWDFWSKEWYSQYLSLYNNWLPQYLPHYYATDLWSRVDIQHFNVSSYNWPPQYYAPHYYAADLWSKEWIFNILTICALNNWPLMHLNLGKYTDNFVTAWP